MAIAQAGSSWVVRLELGVTHSWPIGLAGDKDNSNGRSVQWTKEDHIATSMSVVNSSLKAAQAQ